MRAWRKANAYMRSGHHEKAIYWFSQTNALLEGGPHDRRRRHGWDAGYMLGALVVLLALWVVTS
jgi:hypothetical protein